MELIIKKQIGKTPYTFVVQGENLHDVVMESQKLSFPSVYSCGICKNENLYLFAYITEEDNYKYVKVACRDCKGSVTFGQPKKSPDTFYLRRGDDGNFKWEAYEEK